MDMTTMNAEMTSFIKIHPYLFALLIVWVAFWKILALWKAGKKDHLTMFILLAVINTLGIFEIIYLLYLYFRKEKVITQNLN